MSSEKSKKTVLKTLQEEMGYFFKDRSLLEQALTHRSATSEKSLPNNERLEFLGDRVLGMVIADRLYETYPDADEGELSRRFNALVRRKTCADVARQFSIVLAIDAGRSMTRAALEKSDNVLGNVCEALIGALHRDDGVHASSSFILRAWAPFLAQQSFKKDAKTELQEWALAQKAEVPVYLECAKRGPEHAPVFEVEVSVSGYGRARGEGVSKRQAEQKAAETFLETVYEPVFKTDKGIIT